MQGFAPLSETRGKGIPTMGRSLRLLSAVALSLCAAATGPSRSQAQTQGVTKVVVPFTAGSPNDIMARLIVEELPSRLGRAVIVDNKPGAGSTIGAKAVATAIPDGNTLLFISSSLVIDPVLYSNSDYDPVKSFAPIAAVAATPWVMVVTPQVPARSVGELVAYAKAHPGKLNFGYALGTASQLVGECSRFRPARISRAFPTEAAPAWFQTCWEGASISTSAPLQPFCR
jgi:tripartite-type tricarboxylate transporter receptor subunit TctC